MLPCKLPLIVIVAHKSYIVNRQIGVKKSKYRVTDDPHLQVGKGSCDLLLKFWDPLHISGTVGARNVKFGTQMHHQGY